MEERKWFKEMSLYQIWPRSFCDGNGDGIGDLKGVLSKLEYIKSLGADAIWFSPLYVSPQADYGYDIADYKNINPEYGTLDDFRQVLERAHALGMRVIMDLVINHTSDKHEWFVKSCQRIEPYTDFYIWRKGKGKDGKKAPNNWMSILLLSESFLCYGTCILRLAYFSATVAFRKTRSENAGATVCPDATRISDRLRTDPAPYRERIR